MMNFLIQLLNVEMTFNKICLILQPASAAADQKAKNGDAMPLRLAAAG